MYENIQNYAGKLEALYQQVNTESRSYVDQVSDRYVGEAPRIVWKQDSKQHSSLDQKGAKEAIMNHVFGLIQNFYRNLFGVYCDWQEQSLHATMALEPLWAENLGHYQKQVQTLTADLKKDTRDREDSPIFRETAIEQLKMAIQNHIRPLVAYHLDDIEDLASLANQLYEDLVDAFSTMYDKDMVEKLQQLNTASYIPVQGDVTANLQLQQTAEELGGKILT